MVGMKLSGAFLGLFYVLAVFIPPFLTISLIASLIKRYADLSYVQYFLEGIRVGISVILINFLFGLIKKYRYLEFLFLLLGFLLIHLVKITSIYTLLMITFLYFIFTLKRKNDS